MPTIPEILLGGDAAEREVLLSLLPEELVRAANRAFGEWAHSGQVAPAGDWRTWVLMAGRGFGKTRARAEWVLGLVRVESSPDRGGGPRDAKRLGVEGQVRHGSRSRVPAIPTVPLHHPSGGPPPPMGEDLRIALVADTVDEARQVMVEGQSGLLACAPAGQIAEWHPSQRELVFGSGAVATLYSGANPENLRGPQHHFAWWYELAESDDGAGGVLRAVEDAYGGTRLAREEIDGVLFDDAAGSLWPEKLIEASRGAAPAAADLRRVVVGVDPPASAEGTCGIVVCGLDAAGVGHVLGDHSAGGLSPEGWARAVAAAAEAHGADRVVAEKNQGGDMVRAVLRAAGIALPITPASATQGKGARAEPVAGLFECGKARLAGRFPLLEEELGGMVPAGYAVPGRSPDRADAMVWALWALLIAPGADARVRAL